jgi:hypothetical protein
VREALNQIEVEVVGMMSVKEIQEKGLDFFIILILTEWIMMM